MAVQVLLHEVDEAVARGLGARERAAVGEALAGEHALPHVLDALVLAEHEAHLAGARADVAGRHVGVGADMAVEFRHEALAEAHDLQVGLALRVEVAAALAAAHGQRGQAVLEDLLEAQELDDAQVHRRVQAQAALVGPEAAVELHAVAAVHLHVALVVDPRHAEHDDALRLDDALEQPRLLVGWVGLDDRLQGLQHLGDGLDELRLLGILGLHLLDDAIDVTHLRGTSFGEFASFAIIRGES